MEKTGKIAAVLKRFFLAAMAAKATKRRQYLLPRTGNTSAPKINLLLLPPGKNGH